MPPNRQSPQMLEWDLSSALEALGVENSSGSAASLNPPLRYRDNRRSAPALHSRAPFLSAD